MATAAQEEFNNLVTSKERISHHPADASDENDSDTLVDEEAHQSKSSLKSSQHHGVNASDTDSEDESQGLDRRRRPATYSLPKKYAYNANTGPKGVIADAQAFEQEKGIGNKRTYVRTEHFVLPKNQRLERKDPSAADMEPGEDSIEDLELIDDDDDDDEVMRKWREMRVNELKKGMLKRQGGDRRGRYGTLKTVNAMGYLEAVERVPKGTIVVVYVFDDELPISDAYQSHIIVLAQKYPDVKFIALHFEDAEMEHAGIPAVLAYKDGDQFASLVPLRDEVSFTYNVVTNMEESFRKLGIL